MDVPNDGSWVIEQNWDEQSAIAKHEVSSMSIPGLFKKQNIFDYAQRILDLQVEAMKDSGNRASSHTGKPAPAPVPAQASQRPSPRARARMMRQLLRAPPLNAVGRPSPRPLQRGGLREHRGRAPRRAGAR